MNAVHLKSNQLNININLQQIIKLLYIEKSTQDSKPASKPTEDTKPIAKPTEDY